MRCTCHVESRVALRTIESLLRGMSEGVGQTALPEAEDEKEAVAELMACDRRLDELQEQTIGQDETDDAYRMAAGEVLMRKGNAHGHLGEFVQMELCFKRAVELLRPPPQGKAQSEQQQEHCLMYARAVCELADVLTSKGDFDQALPLYEEALAVRRRVLPCDHVDVAYSLIRLAGLHDSRGEYDQALVLYEEVWL